MATYQDSRYNIALPSGSGGAMVPIKTLTASSSGTLSFVNGSDDVVLDSTYRTYIFKWISCHPATNNVTFQAGFRDGSTNYDATITSATFNATADEAGTDAGLNYQAGRDQAQGTSYQDITSFNGNQNDSATSGEMFLFNPSSTTFIKHFIIRSQQMNPQAPFATDDLFAGYCNVTAAIDAVQFKFSSGNIDAGTIKLYGIA
jgi:hypothetical protein